MDSVPPVVAAMLSTTLGLVHYHARDDSPLLDRLAWWGSLLVALLTVLASLAGD